ncbi:hypothetical protein IMG5_133680, partial [Ichthyophthirius multifiliis]
FKIKQLMISPVDGQTAFLWGEDNLSYILYNCGMKYEKIQHQVNLNNFKLHRSNKKYILAHQAHQKQGKFDFQQQIYDLYFSQNSGQNFTLIRKNVIQAQWNRLLYQFGNSNFGIFSTVYDENTNSPNIVYSEDFFQSEQIIQKGADNYHQADFYLFLTVIPSQENKNYELRIANSFSDLNGNNNVKPHPIIIPFDNKDNLSFTIVKSTETQIFISIHQEMEDFRSTNVYVSDWRGYQLSLSLLYNVRNEEGDCDFEKINSNQGVYIANVYDHSKVEQNKNLNKKKLDTHKIKESHIQKNSNIQLQNFRKTLISYDQGANWHPLKAPQKNLNGETITCSGDCGLQLVGRTDFQYGFIYSTENAPGIIISMGNIGQYLNTNMKDLNVYLSYDGGHEWNEVLQGPHIFEIGDHGGIILASKIGDQTNLIKYSWDEGKTWDSIKIDNFFYVEQILTEPSNMEQKFIIQGYKMTIEGKREQFLVSLDFEKLHQRGCKGAEHPGRPDSDYEMWIPKNFKGDQCIFGQKVKYIRRKPTANCYNSITSTQKVVLEVCPCTEEDYECDYGFYRENNQGDCMPLNEKFSRQNLLKPPEDCQFSYYVSKGYQRVVDTQCYGGIDLNGEYLECPVQIQEARLENKQDEIYNNIKKKLQEEINKKYYEKQTENYKKESVFSLKNLVFILQILGFFLVIFFFKNQLFKIFGIKLFQTQNNNNGYMQMPQKGKNSNKNNTYQSNYQDFDDIVDRKYDEEKPVLQKDQEFDDYD